MSRLNDNWKLCLEAARYAKEGAARSANQHYFYSKSPKADRIRHEFLLSCTRSTNYTYENGGVVVDPQLKQRRKLIETLIHGPLSKKDKMQQLDNYIAMWGSQYFWDQAVQDVDIFDEQNSHWKGKQLVKYTGYSKKELKAMTEREFAQVIDYFEMKKSASNTKKFGVGNCDEKASLAAEYLVDHSPAGRKLACCYCDPKHYGVTGKLVSFVKQDKDAGKGDHVFCVYDLDRQSNCVDDWGPNAIIVDGWMNDAYPAREFLTWKYGYNYKGCRINLAQLNIRNMICLSYRTHIKTRYLWTLEGATSDTRVA